MNNKNLQKGFTILVAVVTAGILLIIAMSIGGIALKEQVLSIANKDSQIAFYAADTGMECAMYWDVKRGAFALDEDGATALSELNCNGNDITPDFGDISGDQTVYSYTLMIIGIPVGNEDVNATTCSVVKITKDTTPNQEQQIHTDIDARGYNTCGPSLNRLERGIHYQNYPNP